MATFPSTSAGDTRPDAMSIHGREVSLETKDGKIVRVEDYILRAHSVVFRDMLAVPQGGPSTTEAPIPISATEEELKALLAFATQFDVDEWTDWPIMGRVYELSEIYDFPAVRGRMIAHISATAGDFPWESFVFAAQKDNIEIAELAIRDMHEESSLVTQRHMLPAAEAARVPAAYLIPYVLMLPDGPKDGAFWANVACGFRPRP